MNQDDSQSQIDKNSSMQPRKWFCRLEDEDDDIGPLTFIQLRKIVSSMLISSKILVREADSDEWQQPDSIEGLIPSVTGAFSKLVTKEDKQLSNEQSQRDRVSSLEEYDEVEDFDVEESGLDISSNIMAFCIAAFLVLFGVPAFDVFFNMGWSVDTQVKIACGVGAVIWASLELWILESLIEIIQPQKRKLRQKKQWICQIMDLKFGPFTLDEINNLALASILSPTDQVQVQGSSQWQKADTVAGIKSVFETKSSDAFILHCDHCDYGKGLRIKLEKIAKHTECPECSKQIEILPLILDQLQNRCGVKRGKILFNIFRKKHSKPRSKQ